jgi:hypothetical protein
MSETIYKRMYGAAATPMRVDTEADRQKRAVKVLGGMKVHGSHFKTVMIGEDLIDVPKIEYVNLLEGQIKELRTKVRTLEAKLYRLDNNHSKLLSELSAIRRELSGKISLR